MKISQILILINILVFVACTNTSPVQSTNDKIVVTDFRGKEVKLKKPAEKVVCLIESALSGIYMLQQQNRVVGVPSAVYIEKNYDYYSQLDVRIKNKALPAPGNWDFISIEQIVGLNPDLVIIWSSQTDAIENIEQFKIPVYAVMLHNFNDVYKEIKDFGKLLNCSEKADSLIQFTRERMESIQKNNGTASPKTAYFMWSQGITETSGTQSTVNELFQTAGVENVCDFSEEHVSISIEKIYDWNPDFIVMWHNEKLDPSDIINDPLLKGLTAIKERRVYELPEMFACDFWTLKMQYPAQLIAHWAHNKKPNVGHQSKLLKNMYEQLYNKELLNK